MSSDDLPKDAAPLSPVEYWQESLSAWTDFSMRTSKILLAQLNTRGTKRRSKLDATEDTLTGELLRSLSDLNLRHWQNTARYLEGFPSWMQAPSNMTGSALVDWYDGFQRRGDAVEVLKEPEPVAITAAPVTLEAPDGDADDLTQIKGIGPKLSARLNALGIFHFKQIADWSEAEAQWVDEYLAFKGRVSREAWVPQAKTLSAAGSTTVH